MKKTLQILALVACYLLLTSASSIAEDTTVDTKIEQGKNIAFNRKKGNCLACHYIQGGTLMGNTGPALIAMKQRFPERRKLIAQVNDARVNNSNTFMPPFGAHEILTAEEVKLVVDWLYTL